MFDARIVYIFAGTLFVSFLVARAASPDRLELASSEIEFIRTELNPSGVLAQPLWLVDGTTFAGVWFYPTDLDLAWFSPEERQFYVVQEPRKTDFLDSLESRYPRATWRYYSGPIFLVGLPFVTALVIFGYAAYQDRASWRRARTVDRYTSYRAYLRRDRRFKLHVEKARRRMAERVRMNTAFYSGLTGVEPGSFGSALIAQVESGNDLDAVEIGLEYRTNNQVRTGEEIKADLEDRAKRLEDMLEGLPPGHPVRGSMEQMLTQAKVQQQLNIQDARPSFDGRFDCIQGSVLARTVNRSLGSLFVEPIVNVSTNIDSNAKVVVDCLVRDRKFSLYSQENFAGAPEEKPYYPGIEMDWDISFLLDGRVLAREKFQSRPDQSFKSGGGARAVYRAMSATTFIAMGRRLMKEVGMTADVDSDSILEVSTEAVEALFSDFVAAYEAGDWDGSSLTMSLEIQEFFSARTEESSAIMAAIVSDYERGLGFAADAMLSGSEAAIEALGSYLGDLVGGVLGGLSIEP